MNQPITITIIGAGISGLANAYECDQQIQQLNQQIRIRTFEPDAIVAGNAQTQVFSQEIPCNAKKIPGTDYVRWADMAINDINLPSHKCVAKIMRDTAYHDEEWAAPHGKRLLPLENTE